MKYRVAAAALTGFASFMQAAAAADQTDGWILVQKHEMNGHQTLYIAPSAVRIDSPDLGYSIIANADTGKLALFSTKKGLIYWTSPGKFRNPLLEVFVASGQNPAGLKWIMSMTSPSEQFSELKTRSYQSDEAKTFFSGNRVGGSYLPGAKREARAHHTLTLTKDISTAPSLYDVIAEMQGTPRLGGVPLKEVSQYSDTGNKKVRLVTEECKHARIDASEWQIPKCKETSKATDITSADNSMIEDLMGK